MSTIAFTTIFWGPFHFQIELRLVTVDKGITGSVAYRVCAYTVDGPSYYAAYYWN